MESKAFLHKQFIFYALIIFLFIVCSCSKYEDGPIFSFHSAKDRVENQWTLSLATIDGNDAMNTINYYYLNTQKSGDMSIEALYTNGNLKILNGTWKLIKFNSKLVLSSENHKDTFDIRELRTNKMHITASIDRQNYDLTFIER